MQRKYVSMVAIMLATAVLVPGAFAQDRNLEPASRHGTQAAAEDSLKRGPKPGNLGEQITISGVAESVMSPGSPSGGAKEVHNDVLMFRLKPDNGAAIMVDAGAKAALDRQNLSLRQGDKVTVTGNKMAGAAGSSSNAAGVAGDVILARTIQKGSQTVQVERGAVEPKQTSAPYQNPDAQSPRR